MARQLAYALTSSTSSIKVSPIFTRADFPENGIIQIENELIRYENTTGDEFISCTRGYLGTTAVAHAAGVSVTLYTSVPDLIDAISTIELLSPAAIVADVINNADCLNITTIVSDTLVLTLPSPTDTATQRLLTVAHKTGSLGTVSVNGTDLTASQHKSFLWDGSAWSEVASAGGGTFELSDDENLYFDTAQSDVYLVYSTNHGALLGNTQIGPNQFDLNAIASLRLYANTNADGSGDYIPNIELKTTGEIRSEVASQFEFVANSIQSTTINEFGLKVIDGSSTVPSLQFTGTGAGFSYDAALTTIFAHAGGGGTSLAGSDNDGYLYFQSTKNAESTVWLNSDGSVRILTIGNSPAGRFDGNSTAGETRFMLYDVDTSMLQRVSVGAADSGGVGFKVLRIPN